VLPALAGLLPAGLPRGSVIATGAWGLLCLALAAAASGAGAWCAIAGLPAVGVAAAAGAGLDPDRLLLVPDPGSSWPQVIATLLDGCDLILLRPPTPPSATLRRKLESVARRYGGVLVVVGDWDGAHRRLTVTSQEWAGIGAGHGRLRARRAQVVVEGRGAATRPLARWLWLPSPDGTVTAVTTTPAATSTPAARTSAGARTPAAAEVPAIFSVPAVAGGAAVTRSARAGRAAAAASSLAGSSRPAGSRWDADEPAGASLWQGRSAG
jgi:hypothetical protein